MTEPLKCCYPGCVNPADYTIYDHNDLRPDCNAIDSCGAHLGELVGSAPPIAPKGPWMLVAVGDQRVCTRILTCVYCGQKYPQNTPDWGDSQVLTDHIRVCEKHPMRAAEATIKKLRTALADLVGGNTREELDAMEAAIRALPVPSADSAVILNAIHVLGEVQP